LHQNQILSAGETELFKENPLREILDNILSTLQQYGVDVQ